ncbi:tetratricopeptide repeat protein 13 isoform X3 [Prionailurus viverrinus]|uniref:Tetratricopeptide repeat domain 13 n=2 Tax=Felinae TaxID=338152 RepID=A0ABI7XMN0_FELCA|nr:tetratricopeptide repeat protein 13 isoform X3 [Felis catus]XP_030189908.1 tetratricopeptide repeat protein 13 isoform X3 [Lynx canadensis]XP_043452258.1 tetratricopeptide repeat protein 13 isoform X3 [Prionailurus bengalensis]XP_047681330.1 tetratricopeptide repeat protein 13 isoform X3 [Prionailurus viverrinus]
MAPAGCCCCCYCCWGGAVAAADAARRVLVLLLLGVLSVGPRPGALATEHYSPLSLLKQELQHRQQQEAQAGGGCSPQSGDWGDQYSVECGESSFLNFHDSDCEPKGPPPCDSLLSLNTEKILSQAKSIAEQKRFPFATDNDSTNEELAIAYVLIGSGLYDEAIRHFSTMLQEEPDLVSAIYGRGIAYGKKGLHILSPLGRINEAVNDLTKAIQLQPSARLYRHRGTLYFISEDYATAHEDFQQSLELNKNQPIAMLYKGLTFFHRGLLKEAIESFKEALKQKVDFIDAYKSLGQAYRELGNFEAATESFQKALLLNQNHVQTLQLRGMMLYHHGSLQEALKNFKRCLQLEPYNEVCQYMKGLSHVAMGQFYEGIKAQTKVMLNDPLPGQKASPEYLKVKYLREYSRYLHAHLDTPLTEYNIDVDLPGSFKDHWAKNLPFLIEDYEEQPGLQPHIKDVLHQNFEGYKPEVQELICVADRLGSLMQYETPGFLPNKRIHRAMGLAALEVMQAVQRTWTNSKVRMNGKTRLMQWRDMFDIAVKWRRIADPDQPVLWLDQMPARSLSRGFNNHINLIRGQVINMRYLEYFEKILHFIKDRILVYHGANNPKGLLEVREALEKVHKVEDLLPIMKQFNTKTKDGFTVNTKVPSLKDQGKEYDGFTITITGDKVGNILFSVETQTTEERTQLYHAEIDALYKDLTAKGKVLILSSEFGEADAVCNLILSLVYYFYNLMPLSRGSSVIAYSVIVGALMASGKEVTGKIPKGKLVDFEAMTAPGSEAFSKIAKSWMNLKSISPSYKSLPSVSEAFPTLRSMIEVLNTDSSPRCLKKL